MEVLTSENDSRRGLVENLAPLPTLVLCCFGSFESSRSEQSENPRAPGNTPPRMLFIVFLLCVLETVKPSATTNVQCYSTRWVMSNLHRAGDDGIKDCLKKLSFTLRSSFPRICAKAKLSKAYFLNVYIVKNGKKNSNVLETILIITKKLKWHSITNIHIY